MQVNVIIFGQLTDITGSSTISLNSVQDTNELVTELKRLYPGLENSRFIVAVEKKVISANTPLQNNTTVALLPPFSGG